MIGGPFEAGGRGLCLNRQQRPLFPVKDTSLWFRSQAQRTLTNKYTHMHTYVSLQHSYSVSGEVAVLFLLQHCLNSRQIWPQLLLLHSCSIGSSLNSALATWMGDTKRSCTHSCHMHHMSLRSICCHAASGITVSCKSWGSLMEAQKDQSWRQKIGATSLAQMQQCAVNLELICCCPVVSTDPQAPHILRQESLWHHFKSGCSPNNL